MSSKPLVNQLGTIKNVTFLGFTPTGAWGELIDNSNDAGAKEVRIGLRKWTDEDGNTHNGYYIADDASGMNKEKLSDSCILNNPQEEGSFDDKSGRFGLGGSAALIVISKRTGGVIEKITRSSESRKLLAVEVDYNKDKSCPSAHEASRRQEELWSHLSIRQDGTGTLIIGEVDEETYLEIHRLMIDKSIDGLSWYIATTFRHKIEAGLTIGIKHYADNSAASAATRVIRPFSPSGSLDDPRVTRMSHDILILKDKTTSEIKFAVRDGSDDLCVRSLPLNTKAKLNTKWISLLLASYYVVGVVQTNLAFSALWDKIHTEQIRKEFDKGNLTNFKEKTIVRQYIRSGRCVKSIPTPKRKQGDKSAYPFYENINQDVIMPATEMSDELFGTQVNKSQLDENNIHQELKKLMDHLSNVFSDNLWKKHIPESQRKKKSKSDDATSGASDDDIASSASPVPPVPPVPPAAGGGGAAAVAKAQQAQQAQQAQAGGGAAKPSPLAKKLPLTPLQITAEPTPAPAPKQSQPQPPSPPASPSIPPLISLVPLDMLSSSSLLSPPTTTPSREVQVAFKEVAEMLVDNKITTEEAISLFNEVKNDGAEEMQTLLPPLVEILKAQVGMLKTQTAQMALVEILKAQVETLEIQLAQMARE